MLRSFTRRLLHFLIAAVVISAFFDLMYFVAGGYVTLFHVWKLISIVNMDNSGFTG
jgi:hypothetical protein